MEARDFLRTLLPSAGFIIVATPRTGGAWNNIVVQTVDEAIAVSDELTFQNLDTYFALATYKKERVWNPTIKNPRTKELGKWERRTKSNAYALKSLFLDLDVKADDERAYPDQSAAIRGLMRLTEATALPKPMVVNSGYGIHAYWPLDEFVAPDQWEPVAQRLKAVCMGLGVKIDAKVTADVARVLRLPGTFNFKRDMAAPVEVLSTTKTYPLHYLDGALASYIEQEGLPEAKKHAPRIIPIIGLPAGASELDNLGATNEPGNLDQIAFGCAAIAKQITSRGAKASEPEWRTALGLARFCAPQLDSMRAVSDGHPDFDVDQMQAKVANWTGGPSTCNSFWSEDNETCEGCHWWRKITSPIQLGRTIVEAEPPVVSVETAEGVVEEKIVEPPLPYKRKKNGDGAISIVAESEDQDGNVVYEPICPYDLFPVRILRQTGANENVDEQTVWRMTLPKLGNVDVSMPQALLGDTNKLHRELLAKGFYVNPTEVKATQHYMTAYIRSLSEATERDRVYERLGWHDEHKTFVLPRTTYFADGSQAPHAAGRNLKAVTKGAIHDAGIFDMWLDAMDFYQGEGNAAFRFFIYCSLAAPLFHMTGHKGVLVAASGDTGHGKSTVLEACASVWGEPEPLLVSGGSDGTTTNALYAILGTYHSLPMLWDETTEREADEMRKFLLNISQGKGKERMKGSEHDGRTVTWETIVLSSANTDDVTRLLNSGKDSDPHLMRLVSVDFDRVDRSPEAKRRADDFKRKLREHYGHAGPRYIRYVVDNYDAVRRLIIHNTHQIDRRSRAQSHERYWTAVIASAITAAQIATRIGLLRYDYKADISWMEEHISKMRSAVVEARTSPNEVVSEYLESNVPSTLIMSTQAGNISNIAARPTRGLTIRHELDTGVIYMSRNAFMAYCAEKKANFRKIELDMLRSGALVSRNARKILGFDTVYAKGQIRCWKLDANKLDIRVVKNAQNAVASAKGLPTR